MTETQGLPADRLAATGFGEFQPIDAGDTPEALARNRRIELKFTER
jgi:chemotaxis protein MotB